MSINMFVKRKTRAGKAYAYGMLVSFKTSVTDNFFFNFTPDNFVRSEAAFVVHNSIYYRTLSNVWCKCSGLIIKINICKINERFVQYFVHFLCTFCALSLLLISIHFSVKNVSFQWK